MPKLKVAHCTQSTYGGTHRYIMDLVIRQSYDVTVICPDDAFLSSDCRRRGVRTITVPMVRNISPVHDLIALVRLYKVFRNERFDLVHLHSSKAGFLGRIAARLAGVPAVIYQPHGWAFHDFMPRTKLTFYVFLERVAGHLADRIICISHAEFDAARRYGIGYPDKLALVLSGVDLRIFYPQPELGAQIRAEFGFAPTDVIVGTVARFDERKGIDVLVDAAEIVCGKNQAVKFLLVGDGPMRAELETRTRQIGIADFIRFVGWREDVHRIINAFDVGVLPSRAEGFGLAAAEYMAVGKPVIASDVGGLKDVVKDHETGLLVPASDIEALASAILSLVTDEKRRNEMGQRGRQRVISHFDVQRMIADIDQVYASLGLHDPLHQL